MAWQIKITDKVEKSLKKMDMLHAKRLYSFLRERLQQSENPRDLGEPLKGALREYWRYRVGDYRIICRIEDDILTVLVVHVGHRKDVYKQ